MFASWTRFHLYFFVVCSSVTIRVMLPRNVDKNVDFGVKNVVIDEQFTTPTSVHEYSALMMNCALWHSFETKFVLIFQSDARFCSNSRFTIQHFMKLNYSWIGAPWPPVSYRQRIVFVENCLSPALTCRLRYRLFDSFRSNRNAVVLQTNGEARQIATQ